jgi:hypothetical protein
MADSKWLPQPVLGQTVRRARLKSGRSQEDLAEEVLQLVGDEISAIESLLGIIAMEGCIEINGVTYPLAAPGAAPFYPSMGPIEPCRARIH